MLGGPSRGSPGGSPVIEEEVGGLDPSYRMNGARSMDPSPNGTPGGLPRAKVLFDFEAADDDELTVESEYGGGQVGEDRLRMVLTQRVR